MNYLKILVITLILPFATNAKDYHASLFGAKSDGLTLNTKSIQKGIDYISENGGGRLVFYVGRYLTGAIQLKSNVTIKLEEGAVLVGSESIYDYNTSAGIKAIISANGQQNIGISGKGVIEGRGAMVLKNMNGLQSKGFLLDSLTKKPALIGFENCSNVSIDSVNLNDAAGTAQTFQKCSDVKIASITIISKNGNDPGTIFNESTKVSFIQSFVDVNGKPLQWAGNAAEIKLEKTIDSKGTPLQP